VIVTDFEKRKQELLAECEVKPELFDKVMPRLEEFMEPFVETFVRTEQVAHAGTFVSGLLSDLDHKNVESIAYRYGEPRMPLQWFIGVSEWDHKPLIDELVRQVGETIGAKDGVLVFDPSGYHKSGRQSVGVARQWCGRLGKVDNCQIAIYMGYVTSHEHALVDVRLYLPKEWTTDKDRMKKAGVPRGTRYQTRHQLCLEMLATNGTTLPHSWITGDDEMGRPYWFRKELHDLEERYLLAVPSNTLIRDLEVEPPVHAGSGRPRNRPWIRMDKWIASREPEEWTEINVRDGAKGPLIVEAIKRCVVAKNGKSKEGHPEVHVVIRYRDRDVNKVVKTDYYLANAAAEVSLLEFARAAKAEHRIEECIQRGKSEVGMGDYEVRNWRGWHHHQALSLLASWFLITETKRGKKNNPGDYRSTDSRRCGIDPPSSLWMRYQLSDQARTRAAIKTK
jgi:SRSO17 transposase